jgi:SAM-dependent MidA family methyltransferase
LTLEPGNPALIDLIRAEIENRGPVSFAWFMQQVLYHPEHGYYASGRCAIGRRGDYFTNVSVGPLFGQLLAAQFAEVWERLDETDNFVIVEQGAHHGDLARDVLESTRNCYPDLFAVLRYRIVEPFPILQDRQLQTLQSFRDKVEWRDSIEPFVGIHFSNELLDAMPVRLTGPGWEKLVGFDRDRFVFVERSVDTDAATNQAALDWVQNVATQLQRGYVMAIDYGYSRGEFRQTVQVRAKHRFLDSPFEQIGHADITAYVNWTSIAARAQKNGLRSAGFTDQHHFLTGIISEWPEMLQSRSSDSTVRQPPDRRIRTGDVDERTKRALQTLLHPEMLGRSFQVLALERGIDPVVPLAGFKFARDPRSTLGLELDLNDEKMQTAHSN